MNLFECIRNINESNYDELERYSNDELNQIYNECLANVIEIYPDSKNHLTNNCSFKGVNHMDAQGKTSVSMCYSDDNELMFSCEIRINENLACKILPKSILLNTIYHELGHAIQHQKTYEIVKKYGASVYMASKEVLNGGYNFLYNYKCVKELEYVIGKDDVGGHSAYWLKIVQAYPNVKWGIEPVLAYVTDAENQLVVEKTWADGVVTCVQNPEHKLYISYIPDIKDIHPTTWANIPEFIKNYLLEVHTNWPPYRCYTCMAEARLELTDDWLGRNTSELNALDELMSLELETEGWTWKDLLIHES